MQYKDFLIYQNNECYRFIFSNNNILKAKSNTSVPIPVDIDWDKLTIDVEKPDDYTIKLYCYNYTGVDLNIISWEGYCESSSASYDQPDDNGTYADTIDNGEENYIMTWSDGMVFEECNIDITFEYEGQTHTINVHYSV